MWWEFYVGVCIYANCVNVCVFVGYNYNKGWMLLTCSIFFNELYRFFHTQTDSNVKALASDSVML